MKTNEDLGGYEDSILNNIRELIDEEFTNLSGTRDFYTDSPPGYLYSKEVYDWIAENEPDTLSEFIENPNNVFRSEAIITAMEELGHIKCSSTNDIHIASESTENKTWVVYYKDPDYPGNKVKKIHKKFTAPTEQVACQMAKELLDKEASGNEFEIVKAEIAANESIAWGKRNV